MEAEHERKQVKISSKGASMVAWRSGDGGGVSPSVTSRRRGSKTALLAFTLPQTLQSQILTVFIFIAYFPQNSHKHLLRRLTFIIAGFSLELDDLNG